MKWGLFLAAVMAAAVCGGAAEAGNWYVRGDAAYGWGADAEIRDQDCTSANAMGCGIQFEGDYGDGAAIGFGVGYQVKPWLRTDATLTYRGGYSFEGRENTNGVNAEQKVEAWTGMLNAYLDVRGLTKARMGVFHPFVGAGIGVSHNKLGSLKTSDGSQSGSAPGGDRTDFAWSLTAGTGIMVVKDKLMFDVAYRYTDLGRTETSPGDGNWGGSTSPADATESAIRVHELTAGLRYMF